MKGILLVNLGTPAGPDPDSVGHYLEQFLMDPYVIQLPSWIRRLLVKKLIVPRRKFKSAEKYKKVWTDRGSPLRFHSEDLLWSLKGKLPKIPVELAFRYGRPSVQEKIEQLFAIGVRSLFVLPLYPHYAASSVETVKNQVLQSGKGFDIEIKFGDEFFREQWFIKSWARIIEAQIQNETPDHILFSYHGIPVSHVVKAHPSCKDTAKRNKLLNCPQDCAKDLCYMGQCRITSDLIIKQLSVSGIPYSSSFQSRLGPTAWTEPNTVNWLDRLYETGVRRPLVICPSFVADCLETVEEIGLGEKQRFDAKGDSRLSLSPCLNSDSYWVENLADHLKSAMGDL